MILCSLQVLLIAAFYALVIRKPDTEEEERRDEAESGLRPGEVSGMGWSGS